MVIKQVSIAMFGLNLNYSIQHTIFGFLYLCLGILLFCVPANAGSDVFEVRGVQVDITADTASIAREMALNEGQKQAFYILLQRLTFSYDNDRLPELDNNQITEYVRDFEVFDEKISSVRYLAKLNFRFKTGSIRDLLVKSDIPFAELRSEPVLVLPIFQSSKTKRLWDSPNEWRDAWEKYDGEEGLVPLLHPEGDLRDVGMIRAEEALSGVKQSLELISKAYKTSSVAVIHGVLGKNETGHTDKLQIFLVVYRGKDRFLTKPLVVIKKSLESENNFMLRAARKVINSMNDDWKASNILDLKQKNIAAVTVPITSLEDWLQIQNRLKMVFLITRLEMVLLSLDEVRINIHYVGEMKQLSAALFQSNLNLISEESELVLYFRGKS